MKYLSLLLLVFFGLTAATCERDMRHYTDLYDKTWLHSAEEDGPGYQVYRPNTYNFPPSRGRTGFALEEAGLFRLYAIAPTDGLEEHKGTWKLVKNKVFRVSFPENGPPGFDLELISLSADLLKVRQTFSEKP
jgi:hypothetical protein